VRRGLRIRLLADGGLEVVDPDPSCLSLLRSVDPGFRVETAALPGFGRPRLVATRSAGLLQEKAAVARRALRCCRLCARNCEVDRAAGERGHCGLGPGATVYERYLHVAEEAPINPVHYLSLRGCGLRCRFCQQGEALAPGPGEPLTRDLWDRLDLRGARSFGFVGGNPTESLPAVLEFLLAAPPDFALPIVWNCGGQESPEAVGLLDGVVDAWVPDLKFGSPGCAARLAGFAGLVDSARAAIAAMLRQGVPVFVRVLVLPGHLDCCARPSLRWLAGLRSPLLRVHVLGQYAPDFLVRAEDGPLARRVGAAGVERLRRMARRLGLA
jgi:putative pyruvate formate lyase activating enzyme